VEEKAPATPAAPVKGLGIAAGAKRPGAKKSAAGTPAAEAKTEAPAQAAAAEAKDADAEQRAEAKPEPEQSAETDGDPAAPAAPAAPVKGLGIARGARPPGKR
jgi:hypothetical protein